MRIAFRTRDNLIDVRECPDVHQGYKRVYRPMWTGFPVDGKQPEDFMDYRIYEYTNEFHDGAPLVQEIKS